MAKAAIARANSDSDILILDETTACLTVAEQEIFNQFDRYAATKPRYSSHRLERQWPQNRGARTERSSRGDI